MLLEVIVWRVYAGVEAAHAAAHGQRRPLHPAQATSAHMPCNPGWGTPRALVREIDALGC